VVHQRHQPFRHRLAYPVFYLLSDLDALAVQPYRFAWLKQQRFGAMGFYPQDHGAVGSQLDAAGLAQWVRQTAQSQGLNESIDRITLLSFPRVLGYVFNPISIYLLQNGAGGLLGALYEVRNTFGEMHHYLAFTDPNSHDHRHQADKLFYVSPFIPMRARYHFHLKLTDQQFLLSIQEDLLDNEVGENPRMLTAVLALRPQALTDRGLRRVFCRWPFLTFAVWFAIHYHGLRLWLRGAKFTRRPPHVANQVDVCLPTDSSPHEHDQQNP
jgi:DUF1365 family protein